MSELNYPKHIGIHGIEDAKPNEHRIWVCEECMHFFTDKEIRADAEKGQWGRSCKMHPCNKKNRCEAHVEPYLPELPLASPAQPLGWKSQEQLKAEGWVKLAKDQKFKPIFQRGYWQDRELAKVVREQDYESGFRKVILKEV